MSRASVRRSDFRELRPRKTSAGVVHDVHPLPIPEQRALETIALFTREQRLDYLLTLALNLTVLGRMATYPEEQLSEGESRRVMLHLNEILHTVIGQISDLALHETHKWSDVDLIRSVYDKARAGGMEEWVAAGAISGALWGVATEAGLVIDD